MTAVAEARAEATSLRDKLERCEAQLQHERVELTHKVAAAVAEERRAGEARQARAVSEALQVPCVAIATATDLWNVAPRRWWVAPTPRAFWYASIASRSSIVR